MLQTHIEGTPAPTVSAGHSAHPEKVRHLLFGSEAALQQVIQTLHVLGYAEVNHWTKPLPTGRPGEVMRILTRHLMVE
ncbi:MAG: hypothetical protein EA342_19095 [Leptolyngbya sp. LCM1.Bin17]|nr:MAG: hypothetical protein EA342_19095 [Leptolyngbya sp. LCM1.Bin17]